MIVEQDEKPRLLRTWLGFAPSILVLVGFFVVFALLTYQGGEWARHCVSDCGDGYRWLALGLGGASLLAVVGGPLARLNIMASTDDRWVRLYLQGWEAATGGIAVLWLLTAFMVPIGLFTIPVGVVALSVAGTLRRRLREEAPMRAHIRRLEPFDFHPRYGPYIVTALVLGPLVYFGVMFLSSGGACHAYQGYERSGCEVSGSALRSVTWIVLLTVAAGWLINLGHRFRESRPRPGWLLVVPTGLVLAGATIASHLL